ncbi:MAG: hypothetical protein HOQ21_18190, partial [Dermatophilaceae bacterium]|nr:hypothetical protein [Dermatophilaceae bacterium]
MSVLTLAAPVAGLVLLVSLQKVEERLLGRDADGTRAGAAVTVELAGPGRASLDNRRPAARW